MFATRRLRYPEKKCLVQDSRPHFLHRQPSFCKFSVQKQPLVRSLLLRLVLGDGLRLRLNEPWDFLAGECWVWPIFASSGSTARLGAPRRWRVECWIWPTFAFEFAFLVRCGRAPGTSPSSESSLANCKIFSLVLGLGLVEGRGPLSSVRLLSAFWPYGRPLGRVQVPFFHQEFFPQTLVSGGDEFKRTSIWLFSHIFRHYPNKFVYGLKW